MTVAAPEPALPALRRLLRSTAIAAIVLALLVILAASLPGLRARFGGRR